MPQNAQRPARLLLLALLCLAMLLWMLAGCRRGGSATEAPATTVTPDPAQFPTVSSMEPVATAVPLSDGPQVITLTWWTPPHFSPLREDEAGRLLGEHLAAFSQSNPSLVVQPVLKAPYGQGGLLDFLQVTRKVAPALLPDLVTLHSDHLAAAMRDGLLQPLDEWLSDELESDLYPFAAAVGRLDARLYAVQFEADIEHLVVNSSRVVTVPHTWADILGGGRTYVFPAGSESALSDAFLIQYTGAGGQLGGRNAPFVLDETALFRTLDFYFQGRSRGVISQSVLSLENAEASWSVFNSGRADMAHVMASRYLAERSRLSHAAFGSVPTAGGDRVTMSRGWVLAIVASDAERQAAAARLVDWLLAVDLNSAWSRAANRLPTRRSALTLWGQNDPYVQFLHWELEAALVHPSGASYLEAALILQQAQRAVLDGSSNAHDATRQATGVSVP